MVSRPASLVPLLSGLTALVFYLTTAQDVPFSDGLWLANRVEQGPTPHYNVLYLPLAHAFHRVVGALAGWDGHRSLVGFSALCTALAVAALARDLGRYRTGPLLRAGLALVFAATPCVWFFATVGEVHALQLLAATLATGLALRAREAQPLTALYLTLGAVVLALATHLSMVLLLPGLILLARGTQPGRGLLLHGPGAGRTWLTALAACGLAALAAALLGGSGAGLDIPTRMFGLFVRAVWERMADGVFFHPSEVASFLGTELVAPTAALLLLALVAGWLTRRRGLLLGTLAVLIPYLLVLPQGGVREEGAYYLSILPLVMHLAAAAAEDLRQRGLARRAMPIALALVLAAQITLGVARIDRHGRGGDARVFAQAVLDLGLRDGVVVVSSLPRQHAVLLAGEGNAADDYRRRFDLVPASHLDREIGERLGFLARDLNGGRRVVIDAELLAGDARPTSFLRFEQLLRGVDMVRLVPLPADAQAPLLYEVLLDG